MQSVMRTAYWFGFFIFLFFLALFLVVQELPLVFRVVLVVLLAFLSATFRLEERYSFLSLLVVVVAGLAAGAVFAGSAAQMWSLAFLYVIVFFIGCEVLERKILGM